MNHFEVETRARERAEAYAPQPTGGSVMAGVNVAVAALLGVASVSGFYGWDVRENLLLACLIVGTGFLIGLVAYKNLKRLNRTAVGDEQAKIDDRGLG
ncbi:hypothetical protein [Brevundimonas sp. NIBR11]|uniref:hypothetical protein n=1 Tax=Brevundimonas sp. NIBR11 TaxID=3015999 RepID=UPI0022F0B298|nr:hypothetical protein [Brevundimonas sp. NIBR11]